MSEKKSTQTTNHDEESIVDAILYMVKAFNDNLAEWRRLTGCEVSLTWKYDPESAISVRTVIALGVDKVEKVLYQSGVDQETLRKFMEEQSSDNEGS